MTEAEHFFHSLLASLPLKIPSKILYTLRVKERVFSQKLNPPSRFPEFLTFQMACFLKNTNAWALLKTNYLDGTQTSVL